MTAPAGGEPLDAPAGGGRQDASAWRQPKDAPNGRQRQDAPAGRDVQDAPAWPGRVLMLTGYLWGGGAEWHLLNLVWTLRNRLGMTADVAYLLEGADGGLAAWRARGIEPVRLSGLREIMRAARGYDLVHAHLFKGEVVAAMASWRSRVPLVVTRHSLDWSNLARWQRLVLRGVVQRRARGMIAISEAVAEVCRTALAGQNVPVKVIPHGIEPALLEGKLRGTDIREELGLHGRNLIGTAARLSPDKGLSYLLEAFAQAGDALAGWDLVIAGDGPQRGPLADLAGRLGIADRVHLTGWREDVLDIVTGLDIFVLPSVREGFGLSLLEAMTLGTAAVVSDLPSIRETAGEAAVYVPPADAPQLGEALVWLARDPALREDLVRRSRQEAARFSAEQMVRQTLAFYQSVAGPRL